MRGAGRARAERARAAEVFADLVAPLRALGDMGQGVGMY